MRKFWYNVPKMNQILFDMYQHAPVISYLVTHKTYYEYLVGRYL